MALLRAHLGCALLVGAAASCTTPSEPVSHGSVGLADVPLRDGSQAVTLRSELTQAPGLVVVRVSAGWCALCEWHQRHDTELLTAPARGRVQYVDVVVRDRDNALPSAKSVSDVRERVGASAQVYTDPSLAFYNEISSIAGGAHLTLPAYAVLDGRTLQMRAAITDADATFLAYKLRAELEEVTGEAYAEVSQPNDPLGFAADTAALLRGMHRTEARTADPSNRFADRADAAAIGAALFDDRTLSASGNTACASCHVPTQGFADARSVSREAGVGARNAPSVLTSARRRNFFWDGRADALWTQALGPFENDAEFASARGAVVKRAVTRFTPAQWASTFGEPLWSPDELATIADDARPGRPSWNALPDALRNRVDRSYANVGKAIAAFERTLSSKPTRFDAFLDGDKAALSPDEKEGLSRFVINGCAQCHWGPDLTDDAFHVTRFPSASVPDVGRSAGLQEAARAQFTRGSAWSDAPEAAPAAANESSAHLVGAFKTPSLRAIADTAPYGHAGNLATLEEVLKLYANHGAPQSDARAVGTVEHWVTHFHESDVAPMAAFLRVFSEK